MSANLWEGGGLLSSRPEGGIIGDSDVSFVWRHIVHCKSATGQLLLLDLWWHHHIQEGIHSPHWSDMWLLQYHPRCQSLKSIPWLRGAQLLKGDFPVGYFVYRFLKLCSGIVHNRTSRGLKSHLEDWLCPNLLNMIVDLSLSMPLWLSVLFWEQEPGSWVNKFC